jgi:hypothetical protein
MTNSAWLFLVAAWSVILTCTGYCFYKLLFSDRSFGGDD